MHSVAVQCNNQNMFCLRHKPPHLSVLVSTEIGIEYVRLKKDYFSRLTETACCSSSYATCTAPRRLRSFVHIELNAVWLCSSKAFLCPNSSRLASFSSLHNASTSCTRCAVAPFRYLASSAIWSEKLQSELALALWSPIFWLESKTLASKWWNSWKHD